MHKLHLGCGPVALPGWVNIDLDSPSADLTHDLTQGLPYPDGSVSHIFAEHVIEHLERVEAAALLLECRRVLAPSGTIRMSTPDLAWLSVVYVSGLVSEWGELWQPESPCALLNEGMRAWGHKFLYDRPELHQLFRQAGFNSVVDCEWHRSTDSQLRGLESRPYHHDLIVEAGQAFREGETSAPTLAPDSPFDPAGIDRLLAEQARQLDSLRSTIRDGQRDIVKLRQSIDERTALLESNIAALTQRTADVQRLEAAIVIQAARITELEGLHGRLENSFIGRLALRMVAGKGPAEPSRNS